MKVDRREFLQGTAWMGIAAAAAGCMSERISSSIGTGGSMSGFAVPPISDLRIGVIGVGGRGLPAVQRLAQIPGCRVTALCEINGERMDKAQAWLKEHGMPKAREWGRNGNLEAWKGLCDSDVCDVIYSATPRTLHCAINVYGMAHEKHVMQEVPGAFTIDECWETVEAAERYRRHCMMLENCVYGEAEMLAFNLIHLGKLGEIVQSEVGYTHDQRSLQYRPSDGKFWRIDRHLHQHGNYYPTHGLVPAGRSLDINHGDRFEHLVSMETLSASFETYGRENFPAGDWRHDAKMVRGDVNMSMIHTAKGRNIVLKHNVCTPCPYERGNLYLGTKGIFRGISFQENAERAYLVGGPCQVGWVDGPDGKVKQFFDYKRMMEIREEYRHPFWKVAGDMAQKVGGHGGMDFIMDLRWVYCLQNGLPLDTDVYDLATYSSVVELSERSVNAGSKTLEFPDYTHGGWANAKPFTVDEIDIDKFEFKDGVIKSNDALNV